MKKMYFVLETKGGMDLFDLRGSESLKIRCGKAHFKAIDTGAELYGPITDWKSFKVKNIELKTGTKI